MLKPVGIIAMRSPDGEFQPAVPIMREVAQDDLTEEITQDELARLFYERIKEYKSACRAIERKKKRR